MRTTAALGQLQPHDLLRLYDPMLLSRSAPKWVQTSPARSVWVVVCRAVAPNGRIMVGVRGVQHDQRWTTTVSVSDMAEIVTPEQLVYRIGNLRSDMPAAQALVALRGQLQRLPLRWGPTGSAGFELATGLTTIHPGSDLDVVLRFRQPTRRTLVTRLHAIVSSLPARVNTQLSFAFGTVALEELMSGRLTVLVETRGGPIRMSSDACWRQG